MKEKYKFQYIPQYIIRNWTDGEGKIPYVMRGDNEIHTSSPDDIFTMKLVCDCDEEYFRKSDVLSQSRLYDIVRAVADGSFSVSDDNLYLLCSLILQLYFLSPYGIGQGIVINRLFDSTYGSRRTEEERKKFYHDIMTHDRKMSFIRSAEDMASSAVAFGLDLKAVILEAPDEIHFALGMNPVFFFNPSEIELFENQPLPLIQNGVAVFLPLSPKYAVCLYDGGFYRVRRTEGRGMLDTDDVILINAIMAHGSGECIFSPTEKFDGEYYAHIYDSVGDDVYEYQNVTFSVFRVLASAYSVTESIRDFCKSIFKYDLSINENGYGEMTKEQFLKRLAYAMSLAGMN